MAEAGGVDAVSEFEQRILFPRGAFDKRSPNATENYGIGSCLVVFALVGPAGAISWEMSTGWNLPHVRAEQGPKDPYAFAVEIHSPQPLFAFAREPEEVACELIGGACWTGRSFCAGDDYLAALIEHGEEGVWKLAREWYDRSFVAQEAA